MNLRAARLLIVFVLSLGIGQALAQTYPDKPIRFLLPFGAGSSTDALARVLATVVAEDTGQVTLRELAIMRIGQLNGADYEVQKHTPVALAEGLRQEQIDALSDWRESTCYLPEQRAVLALIDEMTLEIKVVDTTFAAVRGFLDNQEIVELVVTIGAYNMVSRVLTALDIHTSDTPTSGG